MAISRQADRGVAIDVEGDLGVERPHRVVGDGRQVHHAVAAVEVGGLDLADVLDQLPVGLDHGLPVASLEEVEVAADDGVAFLLEQVDQVGPDIALMAGDEDFHGMSLRDGLMECRWEDARVRRPRGLAGGPELVQVLEVALGVHAGPEAAMLEHAELAVARQADQGIALEDAALLGGKIGQKIAVEEEVAAIDPVVDEFGLLAELLDLGPSTLSSPNREGGLTPRTVPSRASARDGTGTPRPGRRRSRHRRR